MEREAFKNTVKQWWREFDPERRGSVGRTGGSLRGDQAELRRCGSTSEVIFCAGFQRLWGRLAGQMGDTEAKRARGASWLAVVAGVLAHVEEDDPSVQFARQLATPKAGDATVSDLRFRRLLRADGPDELLRQLGRAVHLLGGRANVADLAWSVHRICTEHDEQTKRHWALNYYESAPLKK
jgi:CRISPR system Cascade subunit CasB